MHIALGVIRSHSYLLAVQDCRSPTAFVVSVIRKVTRFGRINKLMYACVHTWGRARRRACRRACGRVGVHVSVRAGGRAGARLFNPCRLPSPCDKARICNTIIKHDLFNMTTRNNDTEGTESVTHDYATYVLSTVQAYMHEAIRQAISFLTFRRTLQSNANHIKRCWCIIYIYIYTHVYTHIH